MANGTASKWQTTLANLLIEELRKDNNIYFNIDGDDLKYNKIKTIQKRKRSNIT